MSEEKVKTIYYEEKETKEVNEFSNLKKVLVGIPNTGTIRIETMTSLVYALQNTPIQYSFHTPISCYVHMNREEIVKMALKTEADYILFVDTDMKFQADAIVRLLTMNVDIACAHYHQRKFPPTSVVIQLDPPLDKLPETPIKVRAAGTGFMLIKTEVFKKLKQPWFFFDPELMNEKWDITQKAVGEDVYFCDKARAAGYDIWLEPSVLIGHIGEAVF